MARALLPAPGLALFLLVIVIPAIALSVRSLQLGTSEETSAWPSLRQWQLFGQTLRLAACGAGLAVLLSVPGAYVIGRLESVSRAPAVGVVLLAPLLLPPMIYAFGWQRLGWTRLPDYFWCVWVWASWCWPIPAMLIGSGWARAGRDAYAAALLDSSAAAAFARVALPALVRHALIAALILLVLFVGEYSVPHACALNVLATELVGWAANSDRPADVLLPTLPLFVVTVVALGLLRWAWRGRGWDEADADRASSAAGASPGPIVLLLAVVVTTAPVPIAVLTVKAGSWAAMKEALATYHSELVRSAGVALAAGVVAVVMGMSLAGAVRLRRVALPCAVLFGVMPAALVGEAVLITCQPVAIVYDNWPLVVFGYVARYGWIGLAVAWLAGASVSRDLVAQARTDGASESAVLLRLAYLSNVPLLLCGVAVVSALSLADVAIAGLLQVPSIGLVSLKLIEKFHRFEDGMLVSLSLWLIAGAIPAALLAWVALRTRNRTPGKRAYRG